jgi:high-affinity nickel-transport protein
VFWDLIGRLNKELAGFGYFVVGIFIASWIASYLIYRWRGFGRIVVERA